MNSRQAAAKSQRITESRGRVGGSKHRLGRRRTDCQVLTLCVGEESSESCLLLLPIAKNSVELLKKRLLIIFEDFFMNKFKKMGFIKYNGGLHISRSLLSVVLHE